MKTKSFALLLALVSTNCVAQPALNANDGVRAVLEHIQRASAARDAHSYAVVFDSSGRWDGPRGEDAIGPENVEHAAQLIFSALGPLRTKCSSSRTVSANIVLVDMYQWMANSEEKSHHSVPTTAPGSVVACGHSDFRTTFVLKKTNGRWTVIAARVADLRMEKANTFSETVNLWANR